MIISNFKVFWYYACLKRLFWIHFEKTWSPLNLTIKRLIKKFKLLKSVQDVPRYGRPKSDIKDEKVEEVRLFLDNNAGMSLRRTHLATGISLASVHTIATKILDLYPYSIKTLHEFKPTNFEKGKIFANLFLDTRYVTRFYSASDEAYHHKDGNVNNYNFRIWSHKNPNIIGH